MRPKTPAFWRVPPEWAGQPVFIVAGGTSVLSQPLELLRGRRVIAINSSYQSVLFADFLFFGDAGWWTDHKLKIMDGFPGRIVTTSAMVNNPRVLRLHNSKPTRPSKAPLVLSTNPAAVPMRRTSLAAATNLAFLLNAGAPIVWLGADGRLGDGNRSHHHAPHRKWTYKSDRWPQHHFDLSGIVAGLRARDVTLINASPGSAWDDLAPVMTLAEAIVDKQRGGGVTGNQDPAELAQFLDLVRTLKVRRYLEIGARNGDSFRAVMNTIGVGGYGLAIDIPENDSAKNNLLTTLAELAAEGIAAEAIFGNSQSDAVIRDARARGPFDLIFIDADHRYLSVKADLQNYLGLAPAIVLHDVAAPRGHMSDGHENGVGVLWNEIKHGFRHQEFITPGSQMGVGVIHRDATPLRVNPAAVPPMVIACPAWGAYYIDLACRFTLPAVLASLRESNFRDVTFLIHTDDRRPFRKAITDHEIRFMPLLKMTPPPNGNGKMPRLPDNYWVAFKQAHRDAINETPNGSIVTLLNSDVVVSRECFSVVGAAFDDPAIKTVVSVGIRTAIDHAQPPIGASAQELARWIWGNLHHISKECVWGKGRSLHPTILFFEDGPDVTMHGWHLTPMFVRKDRAVKFKGTIDDDLLSNYRDDEIKFLTGGEVIFAELSPDWKAHPSGKQLNVDDVLGFWRRRTHRPHYLRNFKQRMTVLGNPVKDHPAVDQIVAGLSH